MTPFDRAMADDLDHLKREYARGQAAIRERVLEQRIKDYLVAHPEELSELMDHVENWELLQKEATTNDA